MKVSYTNNPDIVYEIKNNCPHKNCAYLGTGNGIDIIHVMMIPLTQRIFKSKNTGKLHNFIFSKSNLSNTYKKKIIIKLLRRT